MNQCRKPLIHGARRGHVPRRSELKNSLPGIFQHFLKQLPQRPEGVGALARLRLRDDPWERITDWLPGKAGDRGITAENNRLFIEAVPWMLRIGSPWCDLAPALGNRFARLKHFRPLATRFDKLATQFAGFVTPASIRIWLAG